MECYGIKLAIIAIKSKKIKFEIQTDRISEYVGCNRFNQRMIRNP